MYAMFTLGFTQVYAKKDFVIHFNPSVHPGCMLMHIDVRYVYARMYPGLH